MFAVITFRLSIVNVLFRLKCQYYLTSDIPQMKSQWDIGVAASSNYKDLSYHIDNLINDAYSNNQLKEIFGSFNVEYLPPISKTQ